MTVRFEDHIKLVYFIANKYDIKPPAEKEDLVQEGFIGLWKAVQTFKPEKNYRFATYASRCIYNEINMYLRKLKKQKDIPIIDQPLPQSDGTEENATNGDLMLGTESTNPVYNVIAKDIVKRVFDYNTGRKLSPHVLEREKIYFEYLLKGYRQVDIQKIVGTSQRNCSNHHSRIRERIRRYGRKANEEVVH